MTSSSGSYVGYRWGPFLRAPDLYFDLLAEGGESFVRLGDLARVTYGIKSGADQFFYVRDITKARLAKKDADAYLLDQHGLTKALFNKGMFTLIRGVGRLEFAIESAYLKPILFNLMEAKRIVVTTDMTKRRALIVGKSKKLLKNKHVLAYIRHGERLDLHRRPTCANRVTKTREWYDLRPGKQGPILWSQAHQYRHLVLYNPEGFLHNKRFFSLYLRDPQLDARLLCAILNSTICCFYKLYLGRTVGREGIVDTDVSAVLELPVPDPRRFTDEDAQRILKAFEAMCARQINAMAPMGAELDEEDRVELDEAILIACGLANAGEVREAVHQAVTLKLTETRELELKALANRLKTAHKGKGPSAEEIAREVVEDVKLDDPPRFPDDFLSGMNESEIIELPGGEAIVGSGLFTDEHGSTASGSIRIGSTVINLESEERAAYAALLANVGLEGKVAVPLDSEVCRKACEAWVEWHGETQAKLNEAVEKRTTDERLKKRTLSLLDRQVFRRTS